MLVAATALALTAGCLGDPPPAPETAPLEVVLEGCTLNRPSVQAGGHDVAVVGSGRVTFTDPAGSVVLTAPGDEATPAQIELDAGTYGVVCEPAGGQLGEARLRVDPAT